MASLKQMKPSSSHVGSSDPKDMLKTLLKPMAGEDSKKADQMTAANEEVLSRSGKRSAQTNAAANGQSNPFEESAIVGSPVAKKRRTGTASIEGRSFFLGCSSEIVQNVYSFLLLKDALALQSTCGQLRNTGNDVLRYSCMVDSAALRRNGLSLDDRTKYLSRQVHVVARAIENNNGNLRAFLINATVTQDLPLLRDLLHDFIRLSTTDNAGVVSVLLEDGRCDIRPILLDSALRKDFTLMAEALQRNECIKAAIKMCSTCNVNIGAYNCANLLRCRTPGPRADHYFLHESPKHCRACALESNRFCKECTWLVCPACVRQGSFQQCVECQGTTCLDPECRSFVGELCASCEVNSDEDSE